MKVVFRLEVTTFIGVNFDKNSALVSFCDKQSKEIKHIKFDKTERQFQNQKTEEISHFKDLNLTLVYLKHVYTGIISELSRLNIKNENIKWCFTVPESWKDECKQKMKKLCVDAGFIYTIEEKNERFEIINETPAKERDLIDLVINDPYLVSTGACYYCLNVNKPRELKKTFLIEAFHQSSERFPYKQLEKGFQVLLLKDDEYVPGVIFEKDYFFKTCSKKISFKIYSPKSTFIYSRGDFIPDFKIKDDLFIELEFDVEFKNTSNFTLQFSYENEKMLAKVKTDLYEVSKELI